MLTDTVVELPTPVQPRPLPGDTRREVMPLDAAMLPDELWAYVADVSDRQQSPPDFVAAAGLVGLSGVIGRKALIQPKRRDTGWQVAPNLWGGVDRPTIVHEVAHLARRATPARRPRA